MEWIAIVATGIDGQIGLNGKIPWQDSTDLHSEVREDQNRFKILTTGHICLMGLKTWKSLPSPVMPNRELVVLTTKHAKSVYPERVQEGLYFFNTAGDAVHTGIALDKYFGHKRNVFVCGGYRVYKDFLPLCNRVELTEMPYDGEADTYFPLEGLKDFSRHLTWKEKTQAKYTIMYVNF